MSKKRYTHSNYNGIQCPKCKSTDWQHGGHIIVECPFVYMPCHCYKCGCEWEETYKIVGVRNVRIVKKE